MMRKTLMFLCSIVAGIAIAASPNQEEAPVEILSASFGTFDSAGPNELVLAPSNVVPLKLGQRYGWVVEVRTRKRSLAIREEFVFPPKSKNQVFPNLVSESLNFPTPRRALAGERQLVPMEGKIYGESTVSSNDSAGHRMLQIFIEGQLGPRFEYDIE